MTMNTKKRILAAFAESGMTQDDFCQKAGISRSTLNRWAAQPDDSPVQSAKLKKIAKALGRTVDELTGAAKPRLSPESGDINRAIREAEAEIQLMKLRNEKAKLMVEAVEIEKRAEKSGRKFGNFIKNLLNFGTIVGGDFNPPSKGDSR